MYIAEASPICLKLEIQLVRHPPCGGSQRGKKIPIKRPTAAMVMSICGIVNPGRPYEVFIGVLLVHWARVLERKRIGGNGYPHYTGSNGEWRGVEAVKSW